MESGYPVNLRIVGLGDSTTAGTPAFLSPVEAPPDGKGNPESQYTYWMMKLKPSWVVLNRGVNGERSDEILRRFGRDVLSEKPDYVIILAGVNDIYQGRPGVVVQENLDRMYSESARAGIIPLAATVLPYNSAGNRESARIRELNGWIRERARALSIPFCDTNAAVASKGNPERLSGTPDGLHPDVAGYRAMGERLVKAIEADSLKRRPEG